MKKREWAGNKLSAGGRHDCRMGILPVPEPTEVLRRRRPGTNISPRSGLPYLATSDGQDDHPTFSTCSNSSISLFRRPPSGPSKHSHFSVIKFFCQNVWAWDVNSG